MEAEGSRARGRAQRRELGLREGRGREDAIFNPMAAGAAPAAAAAALRGSRRGREGGAGRRGRVVPRSGTPPRSPPPPPVPPAAGPGPARLRCFPPGARAAGGRSVGGGRAPRRDRGSVTHLPRRSVLEGGAGRGRARLVARVSRKPSGPWEEGGDAVSWCP